MADRSMQYEFSEEDNGVFRTLANKMGGVGMVAAVVGLANLLITALLVAVIYRDQIPAEWLANLPEDVRGELTTRLAAAPGPKQLALFAANSGVVGLVFLMLGVWTRSAAGAFRRVARDQGSDISWLMRGLGSLRSMYGLIYGLLLVAMLIGLVVAGYAAYLHFGGAPLALPAPAA